jgi:hypothetical protein
LSFTKKTWFSKLKQLLFFLKVELSQIRQEVERRLVEKEEEFECVRRSHQKAIDQLQSHLEAEAKLKAEAQRTKKKLEADVQELEAALEHAYAVAAENQKTLNKYQDSIRSSSLRLEDEQKIKALARENLANAERRAHTIQNALEESRYYIIKFGIYQKIFYNFLLL